MAKIIHVVEYTQTAFDEYDAQKIINIIKSTNDIIIFNFTDIKCFTSAFFEAIFKEIPIKEFTSRRIRFANLKDNDLCLFKKSLKR